MERTITFNNQAISFVKSNYANNHNIYIGMICRDQEFNGMPYGDLTINIIPLSDSLACIDANNCDKELIEELTKRELIYPVSYSVTSGFCDYPVFILSDELLNEWCEPLN